MWTRHPLKRNLKTSSFLDIKFDLKNSIYNPNRKANVRSTYINNQSPSLLKQLTKSIAKKPFRNIVKKGHI